MKKLIAFFASIACIGFAYAQNQGSEQNLIILQQRTADGSCTYTSKYTSSARTEIEVSIQKNGESLSPSFTIPASLQIVNGLDYTFPQSYRGKDRIRYNDGVLEFRHDIMESNYTIDTFRIESNGNAVSRAFFKRDLLGMVRNTTIDCRF